MINYLSGKLKSIEKYLLLEFRPRRKMESLKPPSTSRANSSRGSLKPSKPPSCMPALVLTEDLDSPAQADANQVLPKSLF